MKIRSFVSVLTMLLTAATLSVTPAHATPDCDLLKLTNCTPMQERPSLLPSDVLPNEQTVTAVYAYLEAAVKDLHAQWTTWLTDNGFSEPWIMYSIVMPDTTVKSSCMSELIPSDFPNAFYCPTDTFVGTDGRTHHGRIVLPLVSFYKMWSGNIFGVNSGV